MQQQLVADADPYLVAIMVFNARKIEEARRASPEYRAMKKDLKRVYRRRRLTVLKWRLLAIVGR